MTKPNEERFTIFYSWQSDLPDEDNRRIIRNALREAVTLLESSFSLNNFVITIDEATRDEAGSPNIPMTILQKVSQADVLVCDITTINCDAPSGQRRVPNPNVIFELGYAVAHLGWARIIMLFNKSYGNFPIDAPFDIDRHRASPYNYTRPLKTDKKKDAARCALVKLLFEALKIIIDKKPVRADMENTLTDQEKKRLSDLAHLRWILATLNIPVIDRHIDAAPHKIYDEIFYYWESFHKIYSSSIFYLYDSRMRELIKMVHDWWNKSLSYDEYYHSVANRDVLIFYRPAHRAQTEQEEAAWKTILASVKKLRKALNLLLNYVRENYLDLNIEELSYEAREEYVEFMQGFKTEKSKKRSKQINRGDRR